MFLRKWKKMFFKYANKSLTARYDKPLPPPTDREKELVEELKSAFRQITALECTNCFPGENEWLNNVIRLGELVLNHDPREFLRWDVISQTMCTTNASYIAPELNYLKNHPDWNGRWSEAIEECPVGHPIPYWRYPKTSANLIHHAYHLAQFEEKAALPIDKMNFVFEFGGGYGSMCRLIYRLGFRGRYLLFDLPSFSALQRFFLKSANVTVCPIESFNKADSGVLCISEPEQLREILLNHIRPAEAIFIATWSVSEAPVDLRDVILTLVSSFKAFLIAYQERFADVDNIEFFANWKAAQPDIEWHDWRIDQIRNNNRYLIGRRRGN